MELLKAYALTIEIVGWIVVIGLTIFIIIWLFDPILPKEIRKRQKESSQKKTKSLLEHKVVIPEFYDLTLKVNHLEVQIIGWTERLKEDGIPNTEREKIKKRLNEYIDKKEKIMGVFNDY